MSLVSRGAAIQLGIGSVPQAGAHTLAAGDIGDLRIVGLLCDAMIELLGSGRLQPGPGAITVAEIDPRQPCTVRPHRREPGDRDEILAGHARPGVAGAPARPGCRCARQLEVDLSGQVPAEQVAGRPIAGVGGSADFVEGAHLSPGGVRIVALAAATPQGRSHIRTVLHPDTPVTLPRHSVDVVVTEHGAADLRGRSITERAEALTAIADPAHRDELAAAVSSPTTRAGASREHR